jgi:hypothetical protein
MASDFSVTWLISCPEQLVFHSNGSMEECRPKILAQKIVARKIVASNNWEKNCSAKNCRLRQIVARPDLGP